CVSYAQREPTRMVGICRRTTGGAVWLVAVPLPDDVAFPVVLPRSVPLPMVPWGPVLVPLPEPVTWPSPPCPGSSPEPDREPEEKPLPTRAWWLRQPGSARRAARAAAQAMPFQEGIRRR